MFIQAAKLSYVDSATESKTGGEGLAVCDADFLQEEDHQGCGAQYRTLLVSKYSARLSSRSHTSGREPWSLLLQSQHQTSKVSTCQLPTSPE